MNVADLSRASGVAKATLSQLEAGEGNPTLETLWALTASLGVGLGELLEAPAPSLTVVRAKEGVLVRGESVVARLMSSTELGAVRVELYAAEARRRRQVSPAHAHGVVEHILVTRGRLRVGPVDAPVELESGDYLRMSPSWPHVYEGLETGTAFTLTMQFPRS